MARKPRIEFEGALYHVIKRGNQRQNIFKDKEDKKRYLTLLSRYKDRYNFSLYAYVLMNNHIHLLLETCETPLSKILQGINQSYTIYFNKKYNTVGHLFQGRYKAILCDRNEYLLTLLKYIHLNPVRAGIVINPDDYRWSSHIFYTKENKESDLINTLYVLRMFSKNKSKARALLRSFVTTEEQTLKKDVYGTVGQQLLGDEEVINEVSRKSSMRITKKRKEREYSLYEITKGLQKIYNINTEHRKKRGKSEKVRNA